MIIDPINLARALRIAVSDRRKELSGTKLIYFVDADLIAGTIFARAELDKELFARKLAGGFAAPKFPLTRSIVRALFVEGLLPNFRMTAPHLQEISFLLSKIRGSGGVDAYIASRKNIILSKYGIHQKRIEIKRLRDLLDALYAGNTSESELIEMFVRKLSADTFAALEATTAAERLREKGFLANRLDLNSDPGEPLDSLEYDGRYNRLLKAMRTLRNEGRRTAAACRNDVAALLAITKLWKNSASDGVDCEYRFYTQTDPVRDLCESTAGASLLINPNADARKVSYALNSEYTGLRSSMYFILRAILNNLSFEGVSAGENLEEREAQLSLYTDIADAIEHGYSDSAMSQCDPLTRHSEHLGELTSKYWDQQWIWNLVSRRRTSTVIQYLRNMSDESIKRLTQLLDNKPELIQAGIDKNLLDTDNDIQNALRVSSDMIAMTVLPSYIRPFPPAFSGVEVGVSRWIDVTRSPSNQSMMLQLNAVLTGSPVDSQTAISHLIEMTTDGQDKNDLIAGCVGLLTVSIYRSPLAALEQRLSSGGQAYSNDPLLNCLFLWCHTLRPNPDWATIRKFSQSIVAKLELSSELDVRVRLSCCWALIYSLSLHRRNYLPDLSKQLAISWASTALNAAEDILDQISPDNALREVTVSAIILLECDNRS